MMGAVLHTVNVRLSPEQILYAINHPPARKIDARRLGREALELGLDVYAGYGMSEACPTLTLSGLMPKMNGRIAPPMTSTSVEKGKVET
jgi:hypothetical protein